MSIINLLNEMRNHGGPARTTGLTDELVLRFAERDSQLTDAIEEAHQIFSDLRNERAAIPGHGRRQPNPGNTVCLCQFLCR